MCVCVSVFESVGAMVCLRDMSGLHERVTLHVCYTFSQDLHSTAWRSVAQYQHKLYPVFFAKSTADLQNSLPAELCDWTENVQTHVIGNGVRRSELELLVMYASLPNVGILTAIQKDWLASEIIRNLAQNQRRGCAVLFVPNRAQDYKKEQLDGPRVKDELSEDEAETVAAKEESESDVEIADIREVTSELVKSLTIKGSNLKAQEFSVVFSQGSVFGKRRGYHVGIMIVPNHAENVFLKSKLWTRGVISEVDMLPRKDFLLADVLFLIITFCNVLDVTSCRVQRFCNCDSDCIVQCSPGLQASDASREKGEGGRRRAVTAVLDSERLDTSASQEAGSPTPFSIFSVTSGLEATSHYPNVDADRGGAFARPGTCTQQQTLRSTSAVWLFKSIVEHC